MSFHFSLRLKLRHIFRKWTDRKWSSNLATGLLHNYVMVSLYVRIMN